MACIYLAVLAYIDCKTSRIVLKEEEIRSKNALPSLDSNQVQISYVMSINFKINFYKIIK